jgi:uncharacterized protein YndB with AHSA1/START domain
MERATMIDAYGTLTEPATLTIRRRLPGPVERVWAYLTDGDLRRQWLAAGEMELRPGATFELVWRNDELTTPPGQRPQGFGAEHRMQSRITELDAPRLLTFTWGERGGMVTFRLEAAGEDVLLTVTHRGLPDRENTLMVGAGWHMHLDILVARVTGAEPEPFWSGWSRLRSEYEGRVPA